MDAIWLGAGAVGDPLDKAGRANLVAAMLDEGAGELDSQSFKKALEDASARLSFDASRDSFSIAGTSPDVETVILRRDSPNASASVKSRRARVTWA